MTSVDWDSLIEPMALALLGDPPRKRQHGSEWRYRGKAA